jgi:hypothetical protein
MRPSINCAGWTSQSIPRIEPNVRIDFTGNGEGTDCDCRVAKTVRGKALHPLPPLFSPFPPVLLFQDLESGLIRVGEDAAEFAEHRFRVTLPSSQHAPVNLDFVHRSKRHAEIHVMQRTFAADAANPAAHVADFLDLNLLTGMK